MRFGKSIFQTDWWLDAVAGERWSQVQAVRKGKTVAALPFMLSRRAGFTVISSPPLSSRLGPWIAPSYASKSLRHHFELVEELIEQLPDHDVFDQKFGSDFGCTLPFHWHGFKVSEMYSHSILLAQEDSVSQVYASLSSNKKRIISQGAANLTIEDWSNDDDVHRLVDLSYRSRGQRFNIGKPILRSALSAARENDAAFVLAAVAPDRREPCGVVVVFWDQDRAYYSLGGLDRENAPPGTMDALVWEAITRSSKTSRVFDFEGSMMPGIARFFAGFGGELHSYPHVSSAKPHAALALLARPKLLSARDKVRSETNSLLGERLFKRDSG